MSRSRSLVRSLLLAVVLTAVGIVVILSVTLHGVLFPDRKTSDLTPAKFLMNFEQLTLKTSDGVPLAGYYIRGRGSMIVLGHDIGSNAADTLSLAATLNRAGYGVVTFDFRRHGKSGGRISTAGLTEKRDVQAALRFIESRGLGNRVGLVGVGMGSYAGALAAAASDKLSALILIDPYTDVQALLREDLDRRFRLGRWGMPALAAEALRLFVWGEEGENRLVRVMPKIEKKAILFLCVGSRPRAEEDARALYRIAPEPKEFAAIKVPAPSMALAAGDPELDKRVLRFFRDFLASDRPTGKVVTSKGSQN